MKTLKFKYLLTAFAAFCFAVGVFQYVGAKSKTEEIKKTQTELVYFNFDTNENPIPIPEEDLEDSTFEPGANPHGCPSGDAKMCSAGYDPSELVQNTAGDWLPSPTATQYEVRKYN